MHDLRQAILRDLILALYGRVDYRVQACFLKRACLAFRYASADAKPSLATERPDECIYDAQAS